MNFFWGALLVLAYCFSDHVFQLTTAQEGDDHFVNEWAAEIVGGEEVARDVARRHGYRLVRSLHSLPDHYLLERSDVPSRSKRSATHHTKKLVDDENVLFVEQQQQKTRVKRDLVDRDLARDIVQSDGELDDPEFVHQWYLNQEDSVLDRRDSVRADLRVRDVWKKGITGKNVVVTIIDDGLEKDHPDLKANYDPEASYDFNSDDDDPSPRYDPTNENKHGTRCGGEVAMVANNKNCGAGIAFDSKLGGLRILDGRVTDRIEGDSLSFNRKHIDIYSASWGPNDDGRTCEGPGPLAKKALELGIKEGRDGKGSLFAWASGNGGRIGDNCNADGYTSSIYTISVSSATQSGNSPWYSEKCASTLTSTYSSGSAEEGKVVSADLHGECTDKHTGTSAAAPMAAGVLALLLEANHNLTWRDVQHIVVHTSRMEPLALEKGWYKNGAGYCVNLAFGFGLIDALGMVELADPATWENVGEQKICKVEPVNSEDFPIDFTSGNIVEIDFTTDGCKGQDNEVNFLEHIQLVLDAEHGKRGNIYAEIESPSGTITPLMLERQYDRSTQGFKMWPLMSTHNWGEQPQGTWKFRVGDKSNDGLSGKVKSASLVMYGTTEQPKHQQELPKDCGDVKNFAEPVHVDGQSEIDDDDVSDSTMSKLQKLFNVAPQPHENNVAQTLSQILDGLTNKETASKPEVPISQQPSSIADLIKHLG